MNCHTIFLKLYGLRGVMQTSGQEGDNESDIEQGNIVISVNPSDGEIEKKVTTDKTSCIENDTVRLLLNSIYMLFVFGLLLWVIILAIVKSAIYSDGRYFSSNLFAVLYLVQYVTGTLFYNDKFFSDVMHSMRDHHNFILMLYVGSTLFSIVLSASAVIFLVNGLNVNIYTNLYDKASDSGKIFVNIILALDKFYGYGIYFINVITFASVLIYQKSKIANYKQKLERDIDGNSDDTISVMIQEYSEIQENYGNTVNALNNIFASITIFGIIGSYFTIINYNTPFIGVFSYIDTVLFILIEAAYIYSINKIKNILADIKSLVGSPKFVMKYLGKCELVGINGDIYDNYIENVSISDEENDLTSTSGLEVDDNDIKLSNVKKRQTALKKSNPDCNSNGKTDNTSNLNLENLHKLTVSSSPIATGGAKNVTPRKFVNSAAKSNTDVNDNKKSRDIPILPIPSLSGQPFPQTLPIKTSRQNKDVLNVIYKSLQTDNVKDLNKKVDMIKTIIFRNLILTNENCINLDWIILYDKLSEPWECFHIFGFDIDDSQLIQQFISIALGMLGLLRLNVKMGFT